MSQETGNISSDKADKPSLLLKLLATATALLPMYLIFFIILFKAPKFEQMFIELSLEGGLPVSTQLLFTLANTFINYWYCFLPMIFVLSWAFFVWGCKTKTRLLWCSLSLILIAIIIFFAIVDALFLPLLSIMQQIGKN